MDVSATLLSNESVDALRAAGKPVLPMSFGQAGLPVLPRLQDELARNAHRNGYGPVAGIQELRDAAAGYWQRRDLPTDPAHIVCGPGSKALLYGLLATIDGALALPKPSWVSYAAQVRLTGRDPILLPTLPGQGGVPDPEALADAVRAKARQGNPIRAIILTSPDNPTSTYAEPDTIRAVCRIAEQHDILIISDEIYRDLTFPGETPPLAPATVLPDRTITTTGLSKNLALGGWRLGIARLPASPTGRRHYATLVSIASEIWSSAPQPVQHAAVIAFSEPPEIRDRIEQSRTLYAGITTAVADHLRAAGCAVPNPRGGFYLYPGFTAHAEHLRAHHAIHTDTDLTRHLLRHGVATLPGSAFGDDPAALNLRIATSQLTGDSDHQRETALHSDNPLTLPWTSQALHTLDQALRTITTRQA